MSYNNIGIGILMEQKRVVEILTIIIVVTCFGVYILFFGEKSGPAGQSPTPTPTSTPLQLDQELIKQRLAITAGSKITIPIAVNSATTIDQNQMPADLDVYLSGIPQDAIYRKIEFAGSAAGYSLTYYQSAPAKGIYENILNNIRTVKTIEVLYASRASRFAIIETSGVKYLVSMSISEIEPNKTEISMQIISK